MDRPGGFGRIVLVTPGKPGDEVFAKALGPRTSVVFSTNNPDLAARVAHAVKDARRVLVRTIQLDGGDLAVPITNHLRRLMPEPGRVCLIARGSYLWSQFTAWEQGPASPAAITAAHRESSLCAAADLVIASTPEMLADLAWRHCIPDFRHAIVPHHVLPADGPGLEPRTRGVILFSGRLVPQKRVDRLIEAISLLRDDLKAAVTLSIVGTGPLEPQLRVQAHQLGVRAQFEPPLPQDALIARMKRCAIYAQVSAFEGHPKAVIEAMSVGCPVIVCDAPGIRSTVRHAVTGLCVQPEPESIRMALEGLLDDPDWADVLGQAAAAHCQNAFSLQRVLDLELDGVRRAFDNAAKHPISPSARPHAA